MIYSDWWANLLVDLSVFLLAVILDRTLPEPPERIHPVVWTGKLLNRLGRPTLPRDRAAFLYGMLVACTVVAGVGALCWLIMVGLAELGVIAYLIGSVALLRSSFTMRGLVAAGELTRKSLLEGDLDQARSRAGALVSRDRSTLSEPLIAAAAIESIAENTTDSFISPWLMFALLGPAGAITYRVANTLDSMWGKRGRFEYLGKTAARFDDALNFLPARLCSLLMIGAGAIFALPWQRGAAVMRRDQQITESPNAGWTMAAMAGLLGRRLEKQGHYILGAEFPEPAASDIDTANRLAKGVAMLGLPVAIALLTLRHWLAG
ncbi:MAG: adenosylcobinamide-phosphate synthase CbiB [Acidimicrobiaceae bacterium]|nr:adenosylcobinamide-phosphate synthase CbiB [Acidimicrobiaceae bacterium]